MVMRMRMSIPVVLFSTAIQILWRGWGAALLLLLFVSIELPTLTSATATAAPHNKRIKFSMLHAVANDHSESYAVVFDAGSTGSRVNVFSFDQNMDLRRIGNDFEFYATTEPGLSSFASNPTEAALSLKPLVQQAESVVPSDLHPLTPLRLGATAGLRRLEGDTSERILQAVRDYFKSESSLKYRADWVSILDGYQEGSYMWISLNYLLEKLGKKYSQTVGVVDLGGASVQMSYAISKQTAENAPVFSEYVSEKKLRGRQYYIYAHSYLNYGREAARTLSFKLTKNLTNPCVINGYHGIYSYGGVDYNLLPPPSGTNLRKCRAITRKALNLTVPCPHKNCTFNGAWNGGGGAGQRNLYLASSFYYRAENANIIEKGTASGIIRPIQYLKAAKTACSSNVTIDNAKSIYPNTRDIDVPFLCMDFVYVYTLLVDGFGVDPLTKVTVVRKIEYKKSEIEASWALGCALDLLSSTNVNLRLALES